MNIIYVVDWGGIRESGVSNKISGQLEAWVKLGHTAELIQICTKNSKIPIKGIDATYFRYTGYISRIRARYKANKYLARREGVSFVYRRYGIFFPFEISTFKLFPTFIELNTNNDRFYRDKSLISYLWHRIQAKSIQKNTIGACAVTDEIKELNLNKYANISVFSNGVQIPKQVPKKYQKQNFNRFIFLAGSHFSWNGVEKLKKIASQLPDSEFLLVGNHKLKSNLPNLKTLNFMAGKKLNKLLSECNFGISTLQLSKVGLTHASPLKNRTYLINGLPIIGVYPDPAFNLDSTFFFNLKLSRHDEILNMPELRNFIKRWNKRSITKRQLGQIDINNIEKLRLRYIKRVLLAKKSN
jgi:hypothetical protein